MSTIAPDAEGRPRRRLPFLICLHGLRVIAVLHLICCLVQPITMGQYLSGDYGMLQWHSVVGSGLVTLTMLFCVVAVAYAIAGGRVWIAVVAPVFFMIEGLQIGMGYGRDLGIHVPLGVGIVVAAAMITVVLWLPRASRDRGARARSRS